MLSLVVNTAVPAGLKATSEPRQDTHFPYVRPA